MLRAVPEPVMDLGEVLKGTDDDGNLINSDKLGQVYYFDYKTARNDSGRKSGKPIGAVLLRNTSGVTLLGKRLGYMSLTAGTDALHNVEGYTTVIAPTNAVLIDPWLPSTGVADDQIFWGIFSGPAPVLLPLASTAHDADIAVGNALCGATGTTTQATTSGRITRSRAANATDAVGGLTAAIATLGRALSARTSQETTAGADLLVDWSIRHFL